MKKCENCVFFENSLCIKNLKNNYGDCKKYKSIPIEQLDKERKSLLVSRENSERLKELQAKLDYFNYGIVRMDRENL